MSGSVRVEEKGGASGTFSSKVEHVTIPVTGMTCAACQSFLQRELSSQAGVRDATVNLMLHNATVSFDPIATSMATLVDTIRNSGYGADLPQVHESVFEEQ
jgi:Cu+-exporting ATPase